MLRQELGAPWLEHRHAGGVPELHHKEDHCCSRSKSLLAAEKVGKSRSTDASYLRRHLNNGLRLPVLLLLSHCSQSSRLRWLTCNLQSESSCAMAVRTNDRRRGLGQVQNRYGVWRYQNVSF